MIGLHTSTAPDPATLELSDARPLRSSDRACVLYVLVGSPAAGKSTWCEANGRGVVLSLDAARAVVGRGEEDQAATPAAVELVHRQADAELAAGGTVTIDATGAYPKDRGTWLALGRRHGAHVVAVVLRTELATALERNALRSRQVPAEVLTAMWRSVAETSGKQLVQEGFDGVVEIPLDPCRELV